MYDRHNLRGSKKRQAENEYERDVRLYITDLVSDEWIE